MYWLYTSPPAETEIWTLYLSASAAYLSEMTQQMQPPAFAAHVSRIDVNHTTLFLEFSCKQKTLLPLPGGWGLPCFPPPEFFFQLNLIAVVKMCPSGISWVTGSEAGNPEKVINTLTANSEAWQEVHPHPPPPSG